MTASIPITILVADDDEEDRALAHEALTRARLANSLRFVTDLGVNSVVSKRVTLQGLIDAMVALGRYWFEIVELPRTPVVQAQRPHSAE